MGEYLNIKNQWGGGPQKGGNQILKFHWGEAKGGRHDFWLKFSGGGGGGDLGGNRVRVL